VDVKLGYLKAVVRMTNSQNELWDAFEKAVRCAAKARRIYDVRQMLADHERRSPTERMDAMAGRMARRANELKPYLNTDFLQPIDFASHLAKFAKTWHYASENQIFAVYVGVCAALAARFRLLNAFSATQIRRERPTPETVAS
jgi:hypothetical protein